MPSDETTVYVGGAIDPETGMTLVRLRLGDSTEAQVFLEPEATVVLATSLGRWAGFATEANRHVALGTEMGVLCRMVPEGSA